MSIAVEIRAKGRLIFSEGVQNISKTRKTPKTNQPTKQNQTNKKKNYFGSGLSQNERRSLRIATWIRGKAWILTVA